MTITVLVDGVFCTITGIEIGAVVFIDAALGAIAALSGSMWPSNVLVGANGLLLVSMLVRAVTSSVWL